MSLQSLQSSTSQRRPLLATLRTTLTHHANEFSCMRLPFTEEPPASTTDARDRQNREQITSTGIVILGLLELVFVGFLVGSTQQGSLHPVWEVIMALAAAGIAASILRLRRLVSGHTGTTTTTPSAGPQQPVAHRTQGEAPGSAMPSCAEPA
jgi:hypothetical protein